MKKIHVDQERCISCSACVSMAPENFDFNEKGLSSVISNANAESELIQTVMESCPTSAISLVEADADAICSCEDTEKTCECEECTCEHCESEEEEESEAA